MSKKQDKIQQLDKVEILTKIQKLREIKDDVLKNGIFNPHGLSLLELNELDLKEEIELEMGKNYVSKIEERISEHKKMADQMFERDQPSYNSQGGNND